MRAPWLQDALERLTAAIRDVESGLAAMKAEHDPLASHIMGGSCKAMNDLVRFNHSAREGKLGQQSDG
jgi:hypothetical protein